MGMNIYQEYAEERGCHIEIVSVSVVHWNITLTRQKRVTFFYAVFNFVKLCYICLCCISLTM